MNIQAIKDWVYARCEEFDKGLFTLDKSLHGKELRDRIFELNQHMTNFNEYSSKLRHKVNLQEIRTDEVEGIAMQNILKDEQFKSVPATLKKYCIENYSFQYKGENVTLNQEREVLQYLTYFQNKLETMFNNIKNTTMACQSGLNYDKEEMRMLPTA